MGKFRTGITLALIALLVGTLIPADTASAWQGSWKYTQWGRAWIGFDASTANGRFAYGQVDDIITDGYCVEIRLRKSGQSWPGTVARMYPDSSRQAVSCGATVDWNYPTGWETIVGARMYRGNGNYTTLWGS